MNEAEIPLIAPAMAILLYSDIFAGNADLMLWKVPNTTDFSNAIPTRGGPYPLYRNLKLNSCFTLVLELA